MPRFWKLIPKPRNGRRVLAKGDPNSPSLTPLPSLEGSKAPGTQLVTLKWILQGGLCRRAEGSCLSSHTRATDWGGGRTWLHRPPSAGGKLNRASQNFHLFQHQMSRLTHDLQCLFQTSHSVTETWPSHVASLTFFPQRRAADIQGGESESIPAKLMQVQLIPTPTTSCDNLGKIISCLRASLTHLHIGVRDLPCRVAGQIK